MDRRDIHVLAAGTVLPGPPVDNAELTRRFSMPPVWEEWIDTFVGTRRRHLATDLETGQVRWSLADMGEAAASRALQTAGLRAGDIDLMVLSTASPDLLMPATVNVVADRLGVDGVPTYQLQSGCCGALQALELARTMLSAGGRRTALVVGAESCAKHLDLTVEVAGLPASEQINGVLFGDGAGAVVLGTDPLPGTPVLRGVTQRLVGLGREPGQLVEWFGRADRHTDRQAVREDYKAIEESVPPMACEVLDELLDELDWKETDVDFLLPPQLGGRMTERIVAGLDLPGATEVSLVADIGNTGNAAPWFQLEQALSRMREGDRAVGIAVESSKWIKAGFALEVC
ncbi:3-oxoacyl-ACP synthase III family protein [Streptomyces diacarni]|uniref:3-oxoacyl-ACP synthase III family protein n=1 Tax=Streptomyces diacarni TaxID=2800381 RepID=UPI0033C614A5